MHPLELVGAPQVLAHTEVLAALLDDDSRHAVLPVPDDAAAAARLCGALGAGEPIADEVTLVISTSGSTGTPKGAQHTAATLRASAKATEAFLGGPGNWLLTLPPHHIAGLQVLLRAIGAGYRPGVVDVRAGFDVDDFIGGADRLDGDRRYTSLVPTQLIKVLDSPTAVAAAGSFDAILVGGAATPEPLRHRAVDAGLAVVCTYGMSETAGGCVYDGTPLDGIEVLIDSSPDTPDTPENPENPGPGRILLGGPVVAHGYRNLPDHPAFAPGRPGTAHTIPGRSDSGRRWFRTDDVGVLDAGLLRVVGRADQAISTGGLTILPEVVEEVILTDRTVAECVVLGLPDPRLGEKVVAAVVASGSETVDGRAIAALVASRLDRFAAPREVIVVDTLPMRGPGKPDRAALRARLTGEKKTPETEKRPADLGGMQAGRKSPGRDFT
ncbi:AMP-binding protein [Gordonia pseudamarae]|uniref:AMP-binding protein n=1 Tax=Gordonia pseudamarae TaxID=2831662 RepID=A0ABX6IMN8_9ACTN|nr:AMP-binding protein [Gordonia sp. (in: high G+C Gram-positive bacteria)]QHN27678.1 AMP-binding protein [Gordonia pseudamarae]QHN36560.1 AMP-binding protein [Gordonia pseudamarae]